MTDAEICLSNFELPKGSYQSHALDKFNNGQYEEVFKLEFWKNLVCSLENCGENEYRDKLNGYLQAQLHLCNTPDRQMEVVAAGLAPLVIFVQKNWTGPLDVAPCDEIKQLTSSLPKTGVLKELVVDGETVVPVVEYPELLYLSKVILEACYVAFKEIQVTKIWFLRCLFFHQQILEELSPELFDKMNVVVSELSELLPSLSPASAIALHLEFARIYMYYSNIQKSKCHIEKAMELSKIEISLSGALGKRTKFQNEDLAQLILKVSADEFTVEEPEDALCQLPNDLKLDDEVRLDKIKFADNSSGKYPNLSGLHQCAILGNLFQTHKSQPKDSLADEELQPLVHCLLDQPKVWSVRTTTLLLRSRMEATHKRTVERSMMQIQVLADSLGDSKVSFKQRSLYLFCSYLPPRWEVQTTLANVLASMGSIKSALEIYLNVQDWENVIACYNLLQMRHKAREIIEQELEKDPSPKLWCLLGDATDDVSHYAKAWEVSNGRSARAQRHWALFYYSRQKYAESIEHFQKSLEINSLQMELWYRLGYAALMEEMWEVSAAAYRRYVVLDQECFEAWNNLARCYCELKQKARAWRALQEALKVDYSNWKVWDNYMVVSSDLRMYDDVLKSYHEILNIKGKHLDLAVLNGLVRGLKSTENGGENLETSNRFRSKLLELFGRLTSQIINDPELWFLYSEVVDGDTPENLTKKFQLLMKSHRSSVNKSGWEKDLDVCNRIIYVLSKLVEVGLSIGKPDVLMSSKLAAAGPLAKVKAEYADVDISEALEKNLKELEKALNAQQ